jgi:hypothetical protein
MSARADWGNLRNVVVLLIVMQVVSVILAWSLNPLGSRSETAFPLLLATNMIAFAIVSYVGRMGNRDEDVNGRWVLVGSAAVLFFMLMVLIV